MLKVIIKSGNESKKKSLDADNIPIKKVIYK